ncbi:uncharacterized protein LOC131950016 [Physella acuta]|uniref:uncharacterized protein LOC131950016 n=1 Tax=Physella acuta TaxID=109671 RepID=UPI0027DD0EE5|nr:uncharacterized protein LOC131950016 [Physella acuta]
MGEPRRPDLRRWLEVMVKSGTCAGLVWENESEMLFRLPWTHQKSRDWKPEDCQILTEWAKHTGRYKEGDPPDYPTWKTRIRTAINKNREIEEVKELHQKEGSSPYKVYRFLPTSPSRPRSERTSQSPVALDPVGGLQQGYHGNTQVVEQRLMSGSVLRHCQPSETAGGVLLGGRAQIVPEYEGRAGTLYYRQTSSDEMDVSDNYQIVIKLDTNELPRDLRGLTLKTEAGILNQGNPENYFGIPERGYDSFQSIPYVVAESFPEEKPMSIEPIFNHDGSLPLDLKSVESDNLVPVSNVGSLDSIPSAEFPELQPVKPPQKTISYMHVQVLYGLPSKVVNSTYVTTQCCRLFFGSPNSRHSPSQNVGPRHEIQMPDFNELSGFDDTQKKYINEALFETEGGEIILTYKDDDIFAERRCLTRVFCTDGVAESAPLTRTKKNRPPVNAKVFDYREKFQKELEAHKRDPRNPVPKDHFILTFGHEILKNDDHPLRVVPVQVVVRHVRAGFDRMRFIDPEVKPPLISDGSSIDSKNSVEKSM